jgi:hypothetical protein
VPGLGAAAVLAAVLGLAGCATARAPLVIDTPDASAAARLDGREPGSYRDALASIRLALEEELGETVPPFQVVFHPDRDAFAQGLASKGNAPAFARATAQTMDGIGGPGWVQLHRPALDVLDWRSRTAMLAHEVVHVLQYAWAGGRRGASEQWLREGFAEWVTMRVLVRMRLVPERAIEQRLDSMRRRVASARRPPLLELRTFQQWLRWVDSSEDQLPYALATVAAGHVVEQHGMAATIHYFRRFETSDQADRAFREAFGVDIGPFDTALQESLRRPAGRRR